jgi:hypothetical protein
MELYRRQSMWLMRCSADGVQGDLVDHLDYTGVNLEHLKDSKWSEDPK